jgi:sulfoxide reductase heme-binding subunit YedZ
VTGSLGANPIEALINRAGFWALAFLLASLLPTTLRILTGHKGLLKVRRLLGLSAFVYACLHLVLYAVVDQALDVGDIWKDVVKRTFITVGLAALLLLVPLAVTSTKGWVQRLGGRAWQRLHRVSYVASVLAVVHFAWKVKADLLEPAVFGTALALMLVTRVVSSAAQEASHAREKGSKRGVGVDDGPGSVGN